MTAVDVTGTRTTVLDPARRDTLSRKVRVLVAATIIYNLVEGAVAISAGAAASSTALVGFGLDSVIEVSSAAAVAWQFSATDHATREAREHRTMRIIAVSFFALAAYVGVGSVRALVGSGEAQHSPVGLVLAALSVLIMPVLSRAQRRAGRELGSASAVADSKQTLLCTYLSAVLLVGLGVNTLFGWSWADPVAAVVIAAVAVREGFDAWRGNGCCTPNASLFTDPTTTNGTPDDDPVDDCCAPTRRESDALRLSSSPTTWTGLPTSSTPPVAEPALRVVECRPTHVDTGCLDGCCSASRG